jgi:LuxR family maltose regulon positive regulatory protein
MAESRGWVGKAIEVLVLEALAHQGRGDTDAALVALERALSVAEPRGYLRTFVDEGPRMASLLHEAAARGLAPDYVRRLLAAFVEAMDTDSPGATEAAPVSLGHRPQSALVESLTERELEVLQLIAEGLSNREIADRLVLALSTVKVHTRNIYGKLGVHSRTQAVMRAQELGLL